jgi:predicted nucleic acid-binding protein
VVIKEQLMKDVHDAIVLQVTPALIARSEKLLETNSLRAKDSLHIACALEWKADLFATADRRKLKAAKNAGLLTKLVSKQGTSADR